MTKKAILKEINKDYKVNKKGKSYTVFEPRKNGKFSNAPFILFKNSKALKTVLA